MDVLFETERIKFIPAKEMDIATIIELEEHPENRDFVWQGSFESHADEIQDPMHDLILMRSKADDSLIGYSLTRYDWQSYWAELRRLVISKKGQGYGKEAMHGMFHYYFETKDLNKVWLDVYPFNHVGIKLYESLGMHRDGMLRQSYYDKERGFLDQIIYSLLRSEYRGDK